MWLVTPMLLCAVLSASAGQISQAPLEEQQADAPPEKPPPLEHTGVRGLLVGLKEDIEHLPSIPNAEIAAAGGGLALAVHPFDDALNARMLDQPPLAKAFFAPGHYLGDTPEQLAFSIGTWVLGHAMHKPKMAHLGMDLLRAQALTVILVQPLKFATHRERPDGSDHQSFPSGHAAITFAAATVIERHLGWKHSLAAYAIATYVAASRLSDNRHYLSDVVFGSAIGVLSGRTVTLHGRETWTFGPVAVPGGFVIAATRTAF